MPPSSAHSPRDVSQVMVSSTYTDLVAHREAVIAALNQLGLHPCVMEYDAAGITDVIESSLQMVRDSAAYVLIISQKYGQTPVCSTRNPDACSITELEFNEALRLGRPILLFLMDENHPTTKKDIERDPAKEEKLNAFRERAKQTASGVHRVYSMFVSLQDLKDKLLGSLHELERHLQTQRTAPPTVPPKPAAIPADISRISKYAPAQLIGRETELQRLRDAWDQAVRGETKRPHVMTFVALGGEGKTSLVAKWAAELAHRDWPDCDAAFAWSFYSQGTREQMAESSDLFLKEALTFFGDAEMANSPEGAFEKGRRLAQLVGAKRAVLILDGLEPLQYAPTSPTRGELKDHGLSQLLKGLAASNRGLCAVTTRYSLPDLQAFWETTAPEEKLLRLSREAGVHLLQTLGVRGSKPEFETLVDDVKGHALTLNLLGTYLRDAHNGDIRHRDRVKLEEANAEEQGGHAFRVMEAYEREFVHEGELGKRSLALLRLLGLFERPATVDCLEAVWRGDAIVGLTDPLVGISETQRNIALRRLEDAKLLTVNRAASGELLSLDAHPLLREYFAASLRNQLPDAWQAAHRRIFEHLCATTKEGVRPTLEELAPLFQAVAHGCHAGIQQQTCDDVFFIRIQRRNELYAVKRLGAFGSDLGAVACFFELPWSRVSPVLNESDQAWLLGAAAFDLRSLGRTAEALEPMRVGLEMHIEQKNWKDSAACASNLSELELILGKVTEAIEDAKNSVSFADTSGNAFQRMSERTTHGDALHQAGRETEACELFREAEAIESKQYPQAPFLSSIPGFRYCDLLLATAERAAWQRTLSFESHSRASDLVEDCHAVFTRAKKALAIAELNHWILDIALDHLTQGRALFYEGLLTATCLAARRATLDAAVSDLRRAGSQDSIPCGLLTRAWHRFLINAKTGDNSAQQDLDEAWDIAARGSMKLFQTDIHLYRARLFFREPVYPWESPAADLAAAAKLIKECGYHRRDAELADAEKAILPT